MRQIFSGPGAFSKERLKKKNFGNTESVIGMYV